MIGGKNVIRKLRVLLLAVLWLVSLDALAFAQCELP